jgi:hypothetical protein
VTPGACGALSLESSEYIRRPRLICRRLFKQAVRCAVVLAALIDGNNSATRIAITAMTTSSSIKVNARFIIQSPRHLYS